jgi:hypothetical protein
VNGVHASNQIVSSQLDFAALEKINKGDITTVLNEIEAGSLKALETAFSALTDDFHARIDRSHRSFLERATTSLISHLDRYGENSVWQYNPMGLRVLLRSSYQIFGKRTQTTAQKTYDAAAADISNIYATNFGSSGVDFNIEAPRTTRVPPPVFLGQTIALDLQGSWWKSWWKRRRGYKAFASGFFRMIMEETDPIVTELKFNQAEGICKNATSLLQEFLNDQRTMLMSVVEQAGSSQEDLDEVLGLHSGEDRRKVVETTLTTLNQYVA